MVARLEQAIAGNEELPGAGVGHVGHSLKKAQKDAQEMPLEAQIRVREAFIERDEDQTIRRRACSRSPEEGGESETIGGAPGPNRWCWICNDNCRAQLHHWSSLHLKVGRGLRSRHGGGGLRVFGRPTGRHEHDAHGWESCGSSTHLWTDHRCYQTPSP